MQIEKYTINGNTYEVYEVVYKGATYKVGDSKLGDLIIKIIEDDNKYYETEVKTEYGETITLDVLDDEIFCFLGDTDAYGRPTEENIYDNIIELLDDVLC